MWLKFTVLSITSPWYYCCKWLVPNFWGQICPIFGQEKYGFLTTTIIILLYVNSSNQFNTHLCVQIFNQFYCLLIKLLFKYIFINKFLKLFTTHIHVYTYKTDDDGRSKQSNFKYTIVVLLWNYCEYQKYFVAQNVRNNVLYILTCILTVHNKNLSAYILVISCIMSFCGFK